MINYLKSLKRRESNSTVNQQKLLAEQNYEQMLLKGNEVLYDDSESVGPQSQLCMAYNEGE
jgi:hypothetical protein